MSVNEAIKLGEQITKPDYPWYSEFNFPILIIIFILIVISIGLYYWSYIEDGFIFRNLVATLLVIIALIIVIFTIAYSSQKEDEVFEELVDEWKNEVAHPYIETLPKTKKEVVYIKIDPELSHEVKGNKYHTYSNEIQRTPLTVSYKDNGIVTVTDWYKASMELTNEEVPYVEYQHLNRDLGHDVDSGNYNLTVHLPESYKFTDIK